MPLDVGPSSLAATARSDAIGVTPASGRADATDGDRATPMGAAPPDANDPLGKALVKRALFPRRAQPVRLGRFNVLGLVGHGGMGVVYACYDDQLDRKVAVKVLHREVVREQDNARRRLLREAQAMARLSHPNIVTVHEVGQVDDMIYVAMEFVRGVTLDAWVQQPRAWRQILSVYLQAGRGLEAAHRAGLVHRDFKPQNAMLGDDGRVKVLDFGLARLHDDDLGEVLPVGAEASAETALLQRSLTRTGVILGTPGYMSPEQHLGLRATAESDQFSFCVSLYQSLYGDWPFSTESFQAMREDAVRGRVAPPPSSSPVPSRVFKALRRGLMAEPGARFASMTELLAELERDPGVIYRRVAALVATAAIAGAGGVIATMGNAGVEQCPDARPELASVWDGERAAEVRAAVRATGSPRAEEILAAIEPQLERYAATWVQMRNDACRAHAEGRQSAHLFDLQTSCLDQRRAALDATVDAFAVAEAAHLDDLVQTVGGLPSLATCADTEALTAAIPPPEDPLLRARVQQHRETLARAEVHEHTAQARLGLQLVESVLADAKATTYEPLLAEAHLRKGSLQVRDGAVAAALQSFDAALWRAIGSGHAAVAALTASRRGHLLAYRLERPDEARAELALIAALNRRVAGDVAIYGEFLNVAGGIHAYDDDWTAAGARWEEAVALHEAHGRLETPMGIGILYNRGAQLLIVEQYAAAAASFRRVIELSERLSGPNHPDRAIYESMLAYALTGLGRTREARARLRELEARVTGDEDQVTRLTIQLGLGQAELALDDGRAAMQHFVAAQRTSPENFSTREWAVLMRAAAAAGDVPAMERARDQALAGIDERTDVRGLYYYDVLLGHGQALASLGKLQEALGPLEQVRSVLVGSDDPVHVMRRGRIALELGRLRGRLGEHEVAESELRAALADFEAVLSPQNLELADAMLALGELALARERLDEAAQWASRAASIYATTAEPEHAPWLRAQALLARARVAE